MILKILQLNIYGGKYLDNVINFLKNNDFDIIHLQEAATGKLNSDNKNSFEEIKNALDYNGIFAASSELIDDKNSLYGNATLYKKNLKIVKTNSIFLKNYSKWGDLGERFDTDPSHIPLIENQGRVVVSVLFDFNGQQIEFLNTHLAWSESPTDTPEKLRQAKLLIDYLKKLKNPFVLTGDFNVDASSNIVKSINKIARNITEENNITNTLNPRLHRIKQLFPKGLAVDFVYITHSLKVNDFKLIEEDLSDHLGCFLEIDL